MYPAAFEYLKARSVRDAIAFLKQHGDDAKLLAGGQSLVPMMKLRVARPKVLIDIHRIADLNYIREESGAIRLGAMTRHVQIEESSLIREKIPMLAEAASKIADTQVRNRGTIGGALVQADPCGDYGAVVLALNAQMKCVGQRGDRVIPATDFFTFAYSTALETDEILTEIVMPLPDKCSAGVYLKLEKVAGDFAIAGAAVQLSLDSGGACNEVGIGVTGAGMVPQKALAVESLLRGKTMSSALIDQAGQLIQESAEPIEDLRGSAAYKKKALGAILRRAIREALQRADARKPS
ncbi:MAG: xanthine dehydrogenase family protein subunit M [Deltaproteobacteria bacterium]|nr:xanthine dehydrogenase family protein subunit M [Deltaproteobacteria bacterium]MBI3064530.1 xanthine dehydrogenase family protein subunit M [Deltaproteobacteria bacterium]